MVSHMEYNEAKTKLYDRIKILGSEEVSLDMAISRILSADLVSGNDVPSFNRSPYDGYCFNSEDTKGASTDSPKLFEIIEEVPCGKVASKKIGKNQAIKILTGAKMPEGADAVVKYEDVTVEGGKLRLVSEFNKNQNVILTGEDVKAGMVLAKKGDIVDMGVVGVAASLGMSKLNVYRKIKIGFVSTGSELLEIGEKDEDGKIYNSNKYIFDAILKKFNVEYRYYGIVYDDIEKLKATFDKATKECDIVLSTGGVSVGDYDLVAKSLKELGFDIFVNGIDMKPGMACCFAEKNYRLVLGLSGNPMSSVTTFYAVVLPAIKKMMGYSKYENEYFKVRLKNSCLKKTGKLRFFRGKTYIENGEAVATLNLDQGNIVIKSLIDCNAMIKVENGEEAREGKVFDCMYL